MADRSDNPQDNARLDRVARGLEGVKDDLTSELRLAEDERAQAALDRERASRERGEASREAKARANRSPRPAGAAAEGTPVEHIQKAAQATRDAELGEKRLTDAQRARLEQTKRGMRIDLDAAAATVRRAQAAEYLAQAGGPYAGQQRVGAIPGPAAAGAGRVEAAVQAAQKRAPVAAYAKPIGPISPVQIQQAAVAAQQLAHAQDEALQRSLALGNTSQRVNTVFAEQARAIGLADNAYTRHGYLTSEFIQAAAKGQVTFSQLGTQVGGTIAKFAGWTAAATAVYGVVGAMSAMYQGAIQSASGVGLLNRVTTQELPGGSQELQQRFRDLSRQFNLPMEDVVQGVYGSAKATGGDLPQALKAAEQALFGVKVGELSAADSTRYLQAIMRGFGADASSLPAIFDSINQAQNRFGGSTGDMIAGVAKAAGIFKLAGGSYQELISLITTGSKVTGATGTEVATAISRSASRSLTPQGADALRNVGLDPNQRFTELLAEASKKAQGGSPEEVNQIARALVPAGGQYARILAPMLQNRELYDKVLKEVRDNSKGSAGRELANALKQPDEQIKRLVVDLERLGSSLAQAGALNGLVLVVKTLDQALNLVNKFVETWNSLTPAPLRGLLTPLIEMAVILRALRRFDAGQSLPVARNAGGAYDTFRTGLSRDPDKRANAEIRKGVEDEKRVAEEQRRQLSQRGGMTAFQVEQSAKRHTAARERYLGATPGSPEHDIAAKDLARAGDEYEDRVRTHQRLVHDQADYVARANGLQTQLNEYEKLRNSGLSSEAAAVRSGIYFSPGTLDRPTGASPVDLRQTQAGQLALFSGGGGAPGVAAGTKAAEEAKREAGRLRSALSGWGASVSQLGIAGRGVAVVGGAAANATRAAATGIRAAGAGLKSLATSQIGALDGAIIAFIALSQIRDSINRQLDESRSTISGLQSASGGPEGIQARVDEYREDRRFTGRDLLKPRTYIEGAQQQLAYGARKLTPFDVQSPREREDAAADSAENFAKSLAQAQKKNVLLFVPQIRANFKRALAVAQTPAEIEKALRTGLSQITGGYAMTFGDEKAKGKAKIVADSFRAQVAELRAAQGDLDEARKQVKDLDSLKQFVGRVQVSFGLQGNTAGGLRAASFGIQAAREQIARDPSKAAEGLQQLNALEQEVTQQVNDTLNRLLPQAKSPAEAGAIRSQAVQQLRTGLVGAMQQRAGELSGSIDETHLAIEKLKQEIAIGGGRPTRGQATALSGLQQRLKSRENRYKGLQDGIKRENETVQAFEAQQNRAQFELEQSVFSATTQARGARIQDPLARARYELHRSNSQLSAIAEEYGKESPQYQQALAQAAQQRDAVVAALISRIQSRGQLRAAQSTNQVAAARATLAATNEAIAELARRHRTQTDQYRSLLVEAAQQQQALIAAQIAQFQQSQQVTRSGLNVGASQGSQLQGALNDAYSALGFVQSLPGANDDQLAQAQIQVNQARQAMADYVRQQAQALVQARAEYDKSRTENPITQARVDLRAAQQAVQFAQTPAERLTALANVNNARRQVQHTVQQERFNSIEFDASIERITKVQEIARLQSLLKDIKGNRDLKRTIQKRIFDLKKEFEGGGSGFNLDPKSIRLPTPYEVFRAVKEGQMADRKASLRGAIQNQNSITVIVNDKGDAQAVYDAIDEAISTGGSSLRAMGIKGA